METTKIDLYEIRSLKKMAERMTIDHYGMNLIFPRKSIHSSLAKPPRKAIKFEQRRQTQIENIKSVHLKANERNKSEYTRNSKWSRPSQSSRKKDNSTVCSCKGKCWCRKENDPEDILLGVSDEKMNKPRSLSGYKLKHPPHKNYATAKQLKLKESDLKRSRKYNKKKEFDTIQHLNTEETKYTNQLGNHGCLYKLTSVI